MKIESFIVFHNGAVIQESGRIDIDEALNYFENYYKSMPKKGVLVLYTLGINDEISILRKRQK